MHKNFSFILMVSLIFLLGIGLNFSQAQQTQEETSTESPESEPEILWVWAEVISVDPLKNELSVKYLDYETDAEKEITINVDDKTTYENVKSLDEIKPQDTLSIDYIVSPEGKNLAKNISVEKPEILPPESDLPAEGTIETESPKE